MPCACQSSFGQHLGFVTGRKEGGINEYKYFRDLYKSKRFLYICIYIYVGLHTLSAHILRTCMCMHAYIHTRTHSSIYMCVCIVRQVNVDRSENTCICTHTYTHTRKIRVSFGVPEIVRNPNKTNSKRNPILENYPHKYIHKICIHIYVHICT